MRAHGNIAGEGVQARLLEGVLRRAGRSDVNGPLVVAGPGGMDHHVVPGSVLKADGVTDRSGDGFVRLTRWNWDGSIDIQRMSTRGKQRADGSSEQQPRHVAEYYERKGRRLLMLRSK